jgi:hypothetical protein
LLFEDAEDFLDFTFLLEVVEDLVVENLEFERLRPMPERLLPVAERLLPVVERLLPLGVRFLDEDFDRDE